MIDEGKVVDFVFFDFSKALDMLCIGVLIRKFFDIGVRGNTLSWINAFLSDRSMIVRVAEVFSSSVPESLTVQC